jgi:diketogulonate reductase-like aldo/keto reductase
MVMIPAAGAKANMTSTPPVAAVPQAVLSNGIEIPMLGIGMDQVWDPEIAHRALRVAFEVGYRSVDTASSYGNEEAVGRALAESGLPREQFFVTTKVNALDHGFDSTLRAFDRSLGLLGLDYLDSYLVHWPGRYALVDTWRALQRLYEQGRVRVIGVCNCNAHHLERLGDVGGPMPMVDQVEWHVYFQQRALAAWCADHRILVEAWSPLMCGGAALHDPVVVETAKSVGRTPAQVILRWHLQQGRRVFPKSVTPTRIAENIGIFDFSLTEAQLLAFDALGSRNLRIGPDPDLFFMR